jgi:UDP-N-acetylglucosamine--N-acetylmuramyl-(pentapeptide) pyrophosphoryl-undecaprenol N-acetylglucosamine transferase
MDKTLVFTGGHHTSALVVAKLLYDRGWNIAWLGHRRSMWGDASNSGEYKDVTALGIPFYNLYAGKLYRTLHPLKLLRIPFGFFQALYYLFTIKPAGIVSFGGYLAVPVVLAGWLLGIPSVTHEQTVTAGLANRFISIFVKKIALTWPSSLGNYPARKTVLIGLPIDHRLPPGSSRPRSSRPLVFIHGGKQGSHILNTTVLSALDTLLTQYRLIHQTGTSTLTSDQSRAQAIRRTGYSSFGYGRQSYLSALRKCDIVVSRSGAHITYDLGLLGKRCVLIPIPWSSHQEQLQNARLLEQAGIAVVLSQADLTPSSLLSALSQAQRLTPRPLQLPTHAADSMVQLIEELFV